MMVATSVVAISAAEADEKVVYNAEAITRLNKIGIFQGYNAADMGADDNVTRAQMALFTGRVLTGKVESNYWESYVNDTTFEDIDDVADYYVGAISYAYEQGVVIGKSDVAFDPNGNVTYQEALTMVVRSLGYTGLSYPNGFINK
ncbi:MAG: S-layer homology domain-containing protein, partial [Clostridia bacterium]|nr:S-layer homology domain-containing protein [Clostridia bacterium]